MKKSNYKGHFCYKSEIGKVRINNEDAVKVLVNGNGNILLLAADGMGGHNKGDYASFETIRILSESFKEKKGFLNSYSALTWLKNIVKTANNSIYTLQDNDVSYKGMGTTLTCALIFKNKLIVLNCGDSRIYSLKNDRLIQLPEDQTYVNFLLQSGQITREEALVHPERHVLTNAIGLFPSISVDIKVLKYNGEKLLLCTDGLYNNVSEKDILNILIANNDVEDKVQSLINLANFNGGSDNISLCLWEPLND